MTLGKMLEYAIHSIATRLSLDLALREFILRTRTRDLNLPSKDRSGSSCYCCPNRITSKALRNWIHLVR
jgi:hypothetical protein